MKSITPENNVLLILSSNVRENKTNMKHVGYTLSEQKKMNPDSPGWEKVRLKQKAVLFSGTMGGNINWN